MAYCKTRTYKHLKDIADRAYIRALESGTDVDYDAAFELEMEVADYAYNNEAEIDWEQI